MKLTLQIFFLLITAPAWAYQTSTELGISLHNLQNNLNVSGVATGAVIASPSKSAPNYFYHWTRDAGLTIGTLVQEYPHDSGMETVVKNWAGFEAVAQQNAISSSNDGEPKFEVNGSVYRGRWGRPQNDGPAIRSWAYMLAYGRINPMVQNDLQYLQAHWSDLSFDLWEETFGHQFFTTYAQMTAFRLAQQVAQHQGQSKDAQIYGEIAAQVESTLNNFIDTTRKLVIPTVGQTQGVLKPAGLDISTILAVLYFGPSKNWGVSQSYVVATVGQMEQVFGHLYRVNQTYPDMMPGIGRYVEDVYDGNGFSGGNPWFLATFGLGEYYCSLAQELAFQRSVRIDNVNASFYQRLSPSIVRSPLASLSMGQPQFKALLNGLADKGKSYINRALFHAGTDRRYSEQFDRTSGYRRGANDLTWSYTASLRALRACDSADRLVGYLR